MKNILAILFIFIFIDAQSQNLVFNPSFEDTTDCSTYINLSTEQMQCPPWFSPTIGSPDYFSSVYDPFCYTISVPGNSIGYQLPKSGFAYVGIGLYSYGFLNYREYIEGFLIDTLNAGHTYCIGFYVAVPENIKYHVDGIGLYISHDTLLDYSTHNTLNVIPQISNPNGNVISDTINWTFISGQYLATGGEKYLTIGNFKTDANTIIDSTNGNILGSYYYIDDVSVIDCTVGINELNKEFIKGQLYPNPASKIVYYKSQNLKSGKVVITDIAGKDIMQLKLNEHDLVTTISITNLCKGIYIVTVQKQTQTEVFKLVVN